MQKINKKLIIVIVSVVALLIVILGIVLIAKKDKKYDYYYTFKYDDNKITQSVEVFDSKGKKQSNYYIFYKDDVVTLTKADKAVLTIGRLDLKDKPELEILFMGEKDKHKMGYKK